MDHNNGVNQSIKGKFVSLHVYLNMTMWITDAIGSDKTYNDELLEAFDNMYYYKCPQCEEDIEEDENGNYTCSECDYTAPDDHFLESECKEVYEYWAVSSWMYAKLREKGYPVAEINNTYIWGRCTTGQAILLDRAISEICEGMEILEGQAYSWENSVK